jgi:hypothetical protein
MSNEMKKCPLRKQNKDDNKNIIKNVGMKNMKKTNDPLEEYFMKKFKEMGIQVVPPKKVKRNPRR